MSRTFPPDWPESLLSQSINDGWEDAINTVVTGPNGVDTIRHRFSKTILFKDKTRAKEVYRGYFES